MRRLAAIGLILGVTLATYNSLPRGGFAFLSWDDPVNILDNRTVVRGEFAEAWSGETLGVYEPLGVLLKQLQVRLFATDVRAFHLTTLGLHAINACLLFFVARSLLMAYGRQRPWLGLRPYEGGLVAALLFALSPMQVEIVAWASGQSYALSGTFFIVSVWAYLECMAPGRDRVGCSVLGLVSLFAYVAAVLSKSAAIFLPVALVIVDVCPLGRRLTLRSVLQKLPYVAVGALLAGRAVLATEQAQASNVFDLAPLARIAYAIGSVPFHLGLALYPAGLLPTYPVLRIAVQPWSESEIWLTAFGFAMTIGAYAVRKRSAWILAVWLFLLAGFLPVSGLVAHGTWLLGANRYGYLPLLALWIALGGVLTSSRLVPIPSLRDRHTAMVVSMVVAWLALSGLTTYRQVQHWRSTEILWRHTVQRDPANPIALNNLGFLLLDQSREPEALPFLTRVVSIQPRNLRARLNLGVTLERLERLAEAILVYREGLTQHPNSAALHNNLSVVYGRLGREGEAAAHRAEAIRLGFGNGPAR